MKPYPTTPHPTYENLVLLLRVMDCMAVDEENHLTPHQATGFRTAVRVIRAIVNEQETERAQTQKSAFN